MNDYSGKTVGRCCDPPYPLSVTALQSVYSFTLRFSLKQYRATMPPVLNVSHAVLKVDKYTCAQLARKFYLTALVE